jgi:AraC-like DNA-binding protein
MDSGLYKSIVWVHALVGVLAKRDIHRDELLRGTNVPPGLLHEPGARVSLNDWRVLVKRAMLLTQDPALAIGIASTAPERALQIVGQLAMASGSLRQALRLSERYRPILGNLNRFELLEEGDRAYFVVMPMYPDPELPQFDAELALGIIYRLARTLARNDGEDAQQVWFAHPAPAYAERYAELFRCPVHFERARNAILFDRKYLDEPLIYSNPALLQVLREGAERMLAQQVPPSLVERVRSILRSELDLGRADVKSVAQLFKLSARAFRRQLILAKAPWSKLVDEARCHVACEELRRGGVPIRELSERLGFSEPSAFNRAFKRWTGMTPAKYSQDGGAAPPTSFAIIGRTRRKPAAAARREVPSSKEERRAARRPRRAISTQ